MGNTIIQLVMWGTFYTMIGCGKGPPLRGELAPVAHQFVGPERRVQCPVVSNHPTFGRIRGCWTETGDTVAYYYSDASDRVVSAGRRWPVDSANAVTVFDSLAQTLTVQFGDPARKCDRRQAGWVIRDLRWSADNYHRALILNMPTENLQVDPFFLSAAQLNAPACEVHYSVPLPR
jgi:hypothetical protein